MRGCLLRTHAAALCTHRATRTRASAACFVAMKRSRSGSALPQQASGAADTGAASDEPDDAARAPVCDALLANADALTATLQPLVASPPPPIAAVYDTLTYARAPHELYVRRHGGRVGIDVLFVGMNPGALRCLLAERAAR
jgi:hypothetical protein